MYSRTYDKLTIAILPIRADERTREQVFGGYRYIIQNNWGSHKAFHTKAGLRRYLREHGLKIGNKLFSSSARRLVGKYTEVMMMDEQKFADMRQSGKYWESRQLSNGSYTRSLIEKTEDSVNVYYLNPNCKREILPYTHD